jgi:hypothetical protein
MATQESEIGALAVVLLNIEARLLAIEKPSDSFGLTVSNAEKDERKKWGR